MASAFRLFQIARRVLVDNEFCRFNDPRYPNRGIARRKDGIPTQPENRPATQFTLIGAIQRAIHDYTGDKWQVRHNVYNEMMYTIHLQLGTNDHSKVITLTDDLGRDGCLALIDKIMDEMTK